MVAAAQPDGIRVESRTRIQPLLSLAEARDELADTERRIAQVEQSAGRCVNPDGRQELLRTLRWWECRQRQAVAQMEAM